MILLRVTELVKRFSKQNVMAVSHANFEVEEGETLVLLGPSGCGKTTILRLIAGFEAPDEGSIQIGDQQVAAEGVFVPPERRGVGMVFQEYALFPHLTVEENIVFGLNKISKQDQRKRVRDVIEHAGLRGLEKRYPYELSGGQQQRVALGRAMAPRPHVILLDEPFSNLDADLRAQMRHDVHEALHRTRTTAVFVTHDQEEAFVMGDRIGVLRDGRLVQTGTPEKVYHSPTCRFVASFVGMANFVPGIVAGETVRTEIGTLPLAGVRGNDGKVDVVVHPDEIDLRAGKEGMARIVSRQFRGNHHVYILRLPSGFEIRTVQPSHRAYSEGSWVEPVVCIRELVIFPSESSRSSSDEA
jgi:iron(III) transport system ATP-binding protein